MNLFVKITPSKYHTSKTTRQNPPPGNTLPAQTNNNQIMKKSIWCGIALILLWLCGMAGCQEKTENLPVAQPVLSTSSIMMPIRSSDVADTLVADDAVVYICKSSGAKRYHLNSDCSGLKRCTHKIEESNVTQAENIGLTLCKYED